MMGRQEYLTLPDPYLIRTVQDFGPTSFHSPTAMTTRIAAAVFLISFPVMVRKRKGTKVRK